MTCAADAAEPPEHPLLLIKPEAFKTLLHPNCSHCLVEAKRREKDLRADDRALCWVQVQADGYTNDGVIPLRFFLSTYRVLSDGWGVFVYDPDAGYARGFSPNGDEFSFHGWRNGVMVMKRKDGTLYGNARLEWSGDGKSLQLVGSDGAGGRWHFDDLRPGKYTVHFTCSNSEDLLKSVLTRPAKHVVDRKQAPFWMGTVTTKEMAVELVETPK